MSKFYIILIFLLISCGKSSKEKTNESNGYTQNKSLNTFVDSLKSMLPKGAHVIEERIELDHYQCFYTCKFDSFQKVELLKTFNFNQQEKRIYDSLLNYATAEDLAKSHHSSFYDINRYWLPLYPHDHKYYTYAPSDWGNCGKLIITDSTFIQWGMEGPYPMQIQSSKKISKTEYELILNRTGLRKSHWVVLNILELSQPMNSWLFEFIYEDGHKQHELYVPIDKANDFNLIVNYSPMGKWTEFEFKDLDLDQLIINH